MTYKIEHNRPDCIGCAACVSCSPKYWEMNEDNLADIKNSKKRKDGWQELVITKEDLDENKEAADCCPVNVIHITNMDTGEKLI